MSVLLPTLWIMMSVLLLTLWIVMSIVDTEANEGCIVFIVHVYSHVLHI